jgi:hypothetical protein
VLCGVSLLFFNETTEGFGLLDQLHQHARRPRRYSKRLRTRQLGGAEANRLGSYGTSMTGACQNVAVCPFGLSTVTWQSYWPGAS